MKLDAEVIIIGGGLAGLVSAIHLRKAGIDVLLIEKENYPHHKVCGEYISNEVLPYLDWLALPIQSLKPAIIDKFELSTSSGKRICATLPLGGFGISRYTLDYFLYEKAKENGARIIHDNVIDFVFEANHFVVHTANTVYAGRMVLGAYGKRNLLDQKMSRNFMQQKSPWLAVKAHYKGAFDANTVALHHFKGGYCGVSTIENGLLNVCYLANYATFKNYKNISHYQQQVLYKNPHLKALLSDSQLQFENPLTIGQISFAPKEQVKNHVLMIGDTAGLIHPLCGNGMSMAIHSAQICVTLLIAYFNGNLTSRAELEHKYQQQWNHNFKARLQTGKTLASLLSKEKLAQILVNGLAKFPALLPHIIKRTHGKPLTIPTCE